MSWVYHQSTGKLEFNGQLIATGYSGAIGYKNNAQMEDIQSKGPIPKGKYSISIPRHSSTTGPYVLPLSPIGHNARGRTSFQIHGDSRRKPGGASSGCIILPRLIRERIWNSSSKFIEVKM